MHHATRFCSKDKYPEIYESKLDLRVFTDSLAQYSMFHKKYSDVSKKIGSLLGFDNLMDYDRYEIKE